MPRRKKTNVTGNGTASESVVTETEAGEPIRRGKRYPKNKTEAVRRAMRRLGPDAMPMEIVKWVWKKYHMEMENSHASTVKSNILKQMRADEGGTTSATVELFQEEEKYTDETASLSIAELRIVKDMLERIGPDRFRALPELFGQ
jgi:hypothetical protein